MIVELLYGVQAALAEGRRVMPTTLRHVVNHLRRAPVTLTSVAYGLATAPRRTPVAWLLAFTADRVALARSSPEL